MAEPATEEHHDHGSASTHGPVAVHPVVVIDREDMASSGMTSLGDLLLGYVSQREQWFGYADYNGFGLYRPLDHYTVLVNGRFPVGDLTLLPLSAVERIEIRNTGVATRHDGGNIAGAINIVLRRDLEGVDVAASGEFPGAAGGATRQGSAVWGGKLGSGHLLLGVDTFHRDEIRSKDRDHSRSRWSAGGRFKDTVGVSTGGNTVYFTQDGDRVARSLGDCSTDLGYTGVLSDPGSYKGEGCGFAYANIAWETEKFDRQNFFASFDQPLGDAASLYFDARLAQANTAFRFAPSVGTFPINKPSRNLLEAVGLEAVDAENGPLRVAHRFLGHGNRNWEDDHQEHEFAFGLQGQLQADVDYDISLRSYRNEMVRVGNTFVSKPLATEAIEAGAYDLTNPLSTDPVHLAAVRRMAVKLDKEVVEESVAADAVFNGAGFELPGGRMQWTVGAEFERMTAKDILEHRDSTGALVSVEDVLGSSGNSYDGERSRRSGFAEVQLPLDPDWTVELGARLDDYDDVGTTNAWKVASAWRANEMLTLRGSWEKGSAPPSLSDLHAPTGVSYPYVCDRKAYTGPLEECNKAQHKTIYGGNPALEPDSSQTFSLGATTSLGPLSLATDWFRMEVSDLPTDLVSQSIVDMEAAGKALPPGAKVIRQAGFIKEIHNPTSNSGEVSLSGFNVVANTNWTIADADAGVDVRWIYVTDYERKAGGALQPGDQPRHRVHGTFRLSRGDLSVAWHTRAIAGYAYHDDFLGSGKFDPWIGHDISFQWRDALMEGLTLQASVLNLTDQGPSADPSDPSTTDKRLDSVRGRTLLLRAELEF